MKIITSGKNIIYGAVCVFFIVIAVLFYLTSGKKMEHTIEHAEEGKSGKVDRRGCEII